MGNKVFLPHPTGVTRYQAVVLLLAAVTCCVGCERKPKMIEIDKSDDGRELALSVGDSVELTLSENPTTGYRWAFTTKPEPACKVVEDAFEPGGNAPGAGGTHRWKFEAVSTGIGAAAMEYRRSWEKDSAAGQTFKVSIRVK